MMVPPKPWFDRDGTPTRPFEEWVREVSNALGGNAYTIINERVSDTQIRRRMKGADGTTRTSANETLS